MNIEKIKAKINESDAFENLIGMEFLSTPDPDTCMAKMHVDKRNMQPFGYLSGGAILALAETLAGVGSSSLCPGAIVVGMNVQANHVHSTKEGDTITAIGTIIHQGRQTHVWNITVTNEASQLVSSISVTNFVKS